MRSSYKSDDAAGGAAAGLSCGCWIGVLVLNLLIGGISVRYLVSELLHQNIAWGWAVLAGLFAGEFTIPAMVVVWALRMAGVAF